MKNEVIFHQQRPDALWPSDFLICSPGWAGYQLAHPGDSIDLSYATQNSRRGRVGAQVAHTLTTSETQGVYCIDNEQLPVDDDPDAPFAVQLQCSDGITRTGRVRKLLPIECWRLQGFSDEQFYKAQAAGLSDSRLYKMAGNAVSVPVISALGREIKRIYEGGQEHECRKDAAAGSAGSEL